VQQAWNALLLADPGCWPPVRPRVFNMCGAVLLRVCVFNLSVASRCSYTALTSLTNSHHHGRLATMAPNSCRKQRPYKCDCDYNWRRNFWLVNRGVVKLRKADTVQECAWPLI
jgi:hypothetical protein